MPFEQRDSSNAPEGYYYSGDYENIHFCVYIGDFEGFEDMPFTISAQFKNATAAETVAQILRSDFVAKGYKFIKCMPSNVEGEDWVEFK